MNDNNFKGNIPSSLSHLRGIQELDLSRNELSGQVPEYFGNFTFLRRLNLSFNDLNGKVPKEGVFKNANDISVVGNKKLCGGIPDLQLPNCTLNAFKERRGRGSLLKAIVLTISAILFSIIILSILVICWKRNSKEKFSFSLSVGNLHRKISYRELHKATNGFSSDSFIGSGSYGMVYKGTFDIDEKIFAVKVLKLENRGASKSFASECQILRNVRHRNLIKVLTVCSSVDFKGNHFHALVFEYMPNGNLDKWLDSKEDRENHFQNLSFMQRLNIAIEVALALEYLHHHCQIPIAHCDLKPGNILLDNDMSAHVGDFGLAKLLCKTANSFSHNHTSSIAIKGSLGYVPPGNETDRVALLAIKDHIRSDPLGALSSWNNTLHFCMWQGVSCSPRHQRVVILDLPSRNLEGSLSPFVGNLSFVRRVSFQENNFHGEIPKEIGRLFRLRHLDLSFNSFQGEILTNLMSCLDLRELYLEGNKFVGNIPVNFDSLSKLLFLGLGKNNFTGTIPPSLGNLSSLIGLSLGPNSLQGSIPNNLGRLSNLQIFQVPSSNLSSEVPHSLYNISSMYFFNVADNQLHGSLPWDMGVTLPNLHYFWVGSNRFTGPVPITLSNASKLESFDAAENNFVGPVVVNFRDLQNLSRLNLGRNQLGTGATNDLSFLTSLSNSSRLEILGLDTNNFGGILPHSMVNLSSNLIRLAMGRNHLTGCIPSGIENLVNLNELGLEGNFLTGTIPFSIGKLSKLQRLILNRNRLQGEIPSSIGNISLLSVLSLAENGLWGRIPESLGNCRHLYLVDLAWNNLSGIIPKQVVGLSSLSQILNLSKNFLIGSLPFEVGSLINLGALDISGNKLSGVIPSVLGNCLLLEYLYMNDNNFKGNIPSSLSHLRGIRELDLSRNELSGQVPEYFGNFTSLQRLNLSFNDLNGEVPNEGVFKNANDISVVGNKKLCGGIPELQLPNCTLNAFKGRRGRRSLLKAIVWTVSAILFSIIVLSILVICWKRNSKEKSSFSSSVGNLHRKISYRELHKATNGFSSDSLIGSGSYGMVYKGTFDIDEKIFAVKVLKLGNRGASKSFASECQILRNVRHRNLIKVLTVCSSVDFKGNDFHALVFEYMPNGNLDKWLHSKEDGENHFQNLSFMQRLNIAIEVALALEYLHHHCEIPIAHCDLKPGNILLDNDMSAHVGDFGLAKLLWKTANSFSHNHTSSIAIKGSLGYVPPEYGMGGEASTEGDAYSYGIMLLEMFTGKRPTDDMFEGGLSLHEFAKRAMPTQVREIVDPPLLLEGNADSNNVNRRYDRIARVNECLVSIVGIGIACSLESPGERMQMVDVVKRLVALRDLLLG